MLNSDIMIKSITSSHNSYAFKKYIKDESGVQKLVCFSL